MWKAALWVFVICGLALAFESARELFLAWYSGSEVSAKQWTLELGRLALLLVVIGSEAAREFGSDTAS